MSLTDVFRSLGRSDAQTLRREAGSLTGTQIIDREMSIPAFDPKKDYGDWPAGAPVTDEGQVWALLMPHNAAHYEGRPGTLRALWGLLHTTNPARAKGWVAPLGQSGLYLKSECYKDNDGRVWRCTAEKTNYRVDEYPAHWEEVKLDGQGAKA